MKQEQENRHKDQKGKSNMNIVDYAIVYKKSKNISMRNKGVQLLYMVLILKNKLYMPAEE